MRTTSTWATLEISIIAAALLVAKASLADGGVPLSLGVDSSKVRHAINQDVYGMLGGGNPLDPAFAAEIKIGSVRWGGDAATRYNWTYNATCDGNDNWFVCQVFGSSTDPGYVVDDMISTYRGAYAGAHALVTIPIIPWIDASTTELCSYPVPTYGAQQSELTISTGQSCGNGMTTGGDGITDTKITYNMVPNSTETQSSWIKHLVSKWGTTAAGGVNYYQLDNEPGGWSNTHRDAIPTTQSYDVITGLGEQYAATIKGVDATAKVIGPSDYGEWGWVLNAPSGSALAAGQYYLKEFAAYDATHGARSLDCFDEHYGVGDASSPEASFNQVRTFWDTTYATSGDFESLLTGHSPGAIMMIPRFQSWVSAYYPGTPICMSEYEMQHTGNQLVDALVLTDALGVFGYYGLELANLFDSVMPTEPEAYAFRMYRNYDGAGGEFGDTSVTSTSSDQTELSIYGALRSSDGALTVMVVNKTTGTIETRVALSAFDGTGVASVYSYSNANLDQIVAGVPLTVTAGALSYRFPAYSATLFVVPPGKKSSTSADAGHDSGRTEDGARPASSADAVAPDEDGAVKPSRTEASVPTSTTGGCSIDGSGEWCTAFPWLAALAGGVAARRRARGSSS